MNKGSTLHILYNKIMQIRDEILSNLAETMRKFMSHNKSTKLTLVTKTCNF